MTSMPEAEFTRAAVIGTGMMGPGIALTLALGGVPCTLLSRTAACAAQGLEKARAQARLLAANDLAGAEPVARAIELLAASTAFDDTIAAATLVVESGPEDLPLESTTSIWRAGAGS